MPEMSGILGLMQFIAIIAGMVWGISKIQTTTIVLSNTIENLNRIIGKLEQAVEKVEIRLIEHAERIAVLEK